ncbi:ribose 5-phosphate isomerase A [Ferruginibacter sp.]|uniref:ribose 5-phosphate isomerase A n=1 Tax=Ferruginibacter sp. TaxID=1940288 RepID=UPI00265AE416|nr:ribose 5-phosphate isomerase A [Ferruginibacter sp.]
MNLKKEAALKAISFIKPRQLVGLGAGSTIAFIVELLSEQVKAGLELNVLTSSFSTNQLLLQKGFSVLPLANVEKIDIYFDGCDQVDHHLNALKSGGGIHTKEKLLASMATQFIVAGDESKYVAQFTTACPLVIEFLPEALRYVPARIQQLFADVKVVMRMSEKKDGAVITENGNYLLDVWYGSWPELSQLNLIIKSITGVVETSLFYNLAHKAIIAGNDGVKIIEKQA